MVLVPITYKGGVFRHDIIIDLIDDLGGYVVQKHMIAQEVILQSLVPREDIELIRKTGRPLGGEVIEAPLVGTEIAVVTPSLEIHHLPHTSCDAAEYLRRAGAKTNMIGLARGFGKRIANLNIEERDVINEHDCAVFLLGNFESCIKYKLPALRRGIRVPIILTGGPDTKKLKKLADPPVEGYVGGIGRIGHRMQKQEGEIEFLDRLVDEVSGVLEKRREEIAKDPLSISPARLMAAIDDELGLSETSTHPTPVTVQIAGLRVKIPYDNFSGMIGDIEIENGIKVKDVADLLPSRMRNYIWIRIKPFSDTKIIV
ncbi:methanogenesis marker protein 7 [Methanolacinia petrolearia DSM 11571]|uniref:Methanogenesis marker protein 7 n=1 Tax=Methanolacinia petrolearia (strain DSM 11571 / OCM 486 / SEBR 4847) TaxID=679926 RepID=E1RIS0_METP4|nr:methanogenesis marker 7 protein [Methanolacinia petrolearia]ADN36662.1 methanogenesis marker protein 7 [Methanolacinia petrolearia DSM 11571]